ncbi:hypothetical protein Tsubulata_048848 [Turnera subulata]|uniref:Major facilitator superfamily (MFS) profile domain-containing protein n=1 Tax=Turnera subulata TaxID=218843 RepID=A0A9Q0GCL1_9ROSI|nr:hypothetical protein Tsubulata_048848 [Turnera subulata]
MAESTAPLLHQSPANAASDENRATIDEVIEKCLGSFGWRQFLQCILVSIAKVFDAQLVFISAYTDAEPTWHCIESNSTSCSSSSDICKIPRHEWAWDAGSPQTIISEWSLQCASPFIKGLPASSFFMGSLVGGFTLATLADSSLGRKNVLLLSCLTMSLASLATIFSTNIWIYSAFRFISGFGWSSIGTCVVVLLTEKVGKNWRGRAGSMSFLFFTLGYISLPGIAYMCRTSSWRSLYMYTSVPIILYCFLVYFLVTESPKWLYIRGREEEAFAVIKGLAPENDMCLMSSYLSSMPQPHKQDTNLNQNFYSSFSILLKIKWARNRMVEVMVLCFGIGMVYYGMPLAVGNLGYNMYLSVLFNALLELPSYLVVFIIVDSWKRRGSIFWLSVLCGILSFLCAYPGRYLSDAARMGMELGSFFFDCTACNFLLIYATELFPTSIRNTATSMARQAFALSGVFSPALIAAGQTNTLFSYGVFGIVTLLCSVFVFPLPETMGGAIADKVHEEEESVGGEGNLGV